MVGRRSARRQMQGMQVQAQQVQPSAASEHDKTNAMQELQKLGELKQKGLLTDEEFQNLKANLIAKM